MIVCQRIGIADPSELFQADIGSYNLVVDLHYYNLFDNFFVNMNPLDNIQFIYNSRETQLRALNRANGPLVFIGKIIAMLSSSIQKLVCSSLLHFSSNI